LEFQKDYYVHLQHYLGKADMAIDALSQRPCPTLNHLLSILAVLCEEFKRVRDQCCYVEREFDVIFNGSETHTCRGDSGYLRNRPTTYENKDAGARRQSTRICDP